MTKPPSSTDGTRLGKVTAQGGAARKGSLSCGRIGEGVGGEAGAALRSK